MPNPHYPYSNLPLLPSLTNTALRLLCQPRSPAPGDCRVSSARWSCQKKRCPREQSALLPAALPLSNCEPHCVALHFTCDPNECICTNACELLHVNVHERVRAPARMCLLFVLSALMWTRPSSLRELWQFSRQTSKVPRPLILNIPIAAPQALLQHSYLYITVIWNFF